MNDFRQAFPKRQLNESVTHATVSFFHYGPVGGSKFLSMTRLLTHSYRE